MTQSRWRSVGSYGRTVHKTIKNLEKKFDVESDHQKSLDIARTIGYLITVQRTLIKEYTDSLIEKRIVEIEKKIGLK